MQSNLVKFPLNIHVQFFKEWNDEVSDIWIRRIKNTQQQLDSMKRVKFTHQLEETDFNEYNKKKYTEILREMIDS